MMIADLHIHSRYSRATSRDCVPELLELWARRKGVALLGTGDFTHPQWRKELQEALVPAEEGLYTLKSALRSNAVPAPEGPSPRFVVSGEISSIYKKNGKVRKIHNLILLPSLEAAEKLSLRLEGMGMNLHSDGRPILGLDSRDLLELTLEACPDAMFIPAHIWTPHFSLFGAYSGFDTLEECFEDLSGHIHALETGLSSDPPMNWRISMLDPYALVSNSDAHSPQNLGREANLLNIDPSYPALYRALCVPKDPGLAGTIEFFPEEGKYHCDGHRACGVCLEPAQTDAMGGRCPVCGKKLTTGVLHRTQELSDRVDLEHPAFFRPFESLVPLPEVIAASSGLSSGSVRARRQCDELVRALGSEFYILRQAPLDAIEREAGPCVAEGVRRLRSRELSVFPGYDGEYGRVQILSREDIDALSGQLSLLEKTPKEKKPAVTSTEKSAPAAPAAPAAHTAPQAQPSPAGQLNARQLEAVTAGERAVAVIAGPGTGKTKTLVSRIAYLIEERGVSPAQITAVTFTNKAAREMRERLAQRLPDKRMARALNIGTFHAICLKQLSRQKERFHVLCQEDALSILSEVLSEMGSSASAKEVLSRISRCKNQGLNPSEEDPALSPIWNAYHQKLSALHALDYDDLLLDGLARAQVAEPSAASPFTHLLVDEFQDVNPLQYYLIEAWSSQAKSLFIIGDPDQSIYGFRGSDAQCFSRFFEWNPTARRIVLTENYRSTPEILRCALPVIRAPGEQPRTLFARRESGAPVRQIKTHSDFEEALFTVKEIGRLVGGVGMLEAHAAPQEETAVPRSFSDVAILTRTHRQAALFEECLQKDGIPYVVAGQDEFLSDPDVRGALAFLRFLLDPDDLLSLRTVLRCCNIPEQEVLSSYRAEKPGLSALQNVLSALAQEQGAPLCALLSTLHAPARSKPEPLLRQWMTLLGLSEAQPALSQLLSAAVLYRQTPEFLSDLLSGREGDLCRSGSRKAVPSAVTLLTLHAAKGLEFPVVFLAGVKKGLIPFEREGLVTNPAEERRLFYVGMTRAKESLYLLCGEPPSPLLSAIDPKDLLCQALPKKKPQGKQLTLFD